MSKENKIVFIIIIVIALTSVLGIFITQKNTAYNDAIEIADNVLKNEGYTLLYLGAGNCDGCHLEESQIKPLLETYDFGFFYINLEELSDKRVVDIVYKLDVDVDENFTIPTLVVYKDGKYQDQLTGLANLSTIFDFLQKYSIISEERELLINYVDYLGYNKLIKSKKKQIIALGSIVSEESNEAQENLWQVAKENDIKINYLSIESLSDEKINELYNSLPYFQENAVDIPMIIIVQNGEVLDSSIEVLDVDEYIQFFKDNGLM